MAVAVAVMDGADATASAEPFPCGRSFIHQGGVIVGHLVLGFLTWPEGHE